MELIRCDGCPGGECPARVERDRLKNLADGMRMIASNWFGLGSHYEHRVGCGDLVEAYHRIAMHDFARADALDEEAQQVAGDFCPIQPRET